MLKRRNFSLSIETSKFHHDFCLSPGETSLDSLQPHASQELAEEYKILEKAFRQDSISFKRQSLVFEVSRKMSKRLSWDYNKTLKMIIEITNLFHMNLVEITYWQVLLSSLSIPAVAPLLTSYITAYQAKLDLNPNASCYEYLISFKIPNFRILFYNWQLVKSSDPSVKEMNQELMLISKRKRKNVDYEKLVDGLMEIKKKGKVEEKNIFLNEEEFQGFDYLGLVLSPIDKM
jgi:hypothetical protein